MEVSLQHVVTGRRIYVHEHSFKLLAADGNLAKQLVELLLTESWVFRVSLHHISSDYMIGAITEQESEAISIALRDRFRSICTPILAAMLVLSPVGDTPMLSSDENLHATCFDSGYYTFATDQASACRMYEDTLPLRALYSQYAMGQGDSDLTMVRGRRLAWIESAPEPASFAPIADFTGDAAQRVSLAVEAGLRQAEDKLARLFG